MGTFIETVALPRAFTEPTPRPGPGITPKPPRPTRPPLLLHPRPRPRGLTQEEEEEAIRGEEARRRAGGLLLRPRPTPVPPPLAPAPAELPFMTEGEYEQRYAPLRGQVQAAARPPGRRIAAYPQEEQGRWFIETAVGLGRYRRWFDTQEEAWAFYYRQPMYQPSGVAPSYPAPSPFGAAPPPPEPLPLAVAYPRAFLKGLPRGIAGPIARTEPFVRIPGAREWAGPEPPRPEPGSRESYLEALFLAPGTTGLRGFGPVFETMGQAWRGRQLAQAGLRRGVGLAGETLVPPVRRFVAEEAGAAGKRLPISKVRQDLKDELLRRRDAGERLPVGLQGSATDRRISKYVEEMSDSFAEDWHRTVFRAAPEAAAAKVPGAESAAARGGQSRAEQFSAGLKARSLLEGGEVDPRTAAHAWRSMGPVEYERLVAGQTFGGGGAKRGGYWSWFPERASIQEGTKTKPKYLVEVRGQSEGEALVTSHTSADVTGVWKSEGKGWVKQPLPEAAAPAGQARAPQALPPARPGILTPEGIVEAGPEAPPRMVSIGEMQPPPPLPPEAAFGPGGETPFVRAKRALILELERQQRGRETGAAARAIARGREEQARGVSAGVTAAVERGAAPEEIVAAGRKGAAVGPLTEARALQLTPESRNALYLRVIEAKEAGELSSFEFLQATDALNRVFESGGFAHPGQAKLLRRVLGEDVAKALRPAEDAAEILRTEKYVASVAAKARQAELKAQQAENLRAIATAERRDELAIRAANRADAEEMEATRRYIQQVEAKGARAPTVAEQRATLREARMRETLDRMTPNEEMLRAKAKEISKGVPFADEAIDVWLQGNRVLVDSVKSEQGWAEAYKSIEGAITGNTKDSYVNVLLTRKAIVQDALIRSGMEPNLAYRASDQLMYSELVERFGAGAIRVEKGRVVYGPKVPQRIVEALEVVKNSTYDQSLGAVNTLVQRSKNSIFGVDFAIGMIQGLAAVERGGVSILAGYVNRTLGVLHLPNARILSTETNLSKQVQFALDNVHRAIGPSPVRPEAGTPLRYLGRPGEMIDRPITAVIGKLTDIQFGTILTHIGDVAYEGNLAILRAVGKDISNPAVRASAAENSNMVRSFAQTALQRRRGQLESIVAISPAMTRSQVAHITQMAKVFAPGVSSTERILGALTILSSVGSVFLVGKYVNDLIGTEDFQFNPAKPGFGNIVLPGGKVINLFPQEAVQKAVARSLLELGKMEPQEAAEVWARYSLGHTTIAGQVPAAAAGAGWEPGYGTKLTGLSGKGKVLNILPVPTMVQQFFTAEGPTPEGMALQFFGVNTYPESPYQMIMWQAKQDGVINPTTGRVVESLDQIPASVFQKYEQQPHIRAAVDRVLGGTEAGKVEAERLRNEREWARLYRSGERTGPQLLDAYDTLQGNAAILRQRLLGVSDRPDDPFKAAVWDYGEAFRKATLAGVLDRQSLEENLSTLESQWDEKTAKYVLENTGTARHDEPEFREIQALKKKLREAHYWDPWNGNYIRLTPEQRASYESYLGAKRADEQTWVRVEGEAERPKTNRTAWMRAGGDPYLAFAIDKDVKNIRLYIRSKNPDIEAGLTKFYGLKPLETEP